MPLSYSQFWPELGNPTDLVHHKVSICIPQEMAPAIDLWFQWRKLVALTLWFSQLSFNQWDCSKIPWAVINARDLNVKTSQQKDISGFRLALDILCNWIECDVGIYFSAPRFHHPFLGLQCEFVFQISWINKRFFFSIFGESIFFILPAFGSSDSNGNGISSQQPSELGIIIVRVMMNDNLFSFFSNQKQIQLWSVMYREIRCSMLQQIFLKLGYKHQSCLESKLKSITRLKTNFAGKWTSMKHIETPWIHGC